MVIAVITGDIINSQHTDPELWVPALTQLFEGWGRSSVDWELYRGDEFQVRTEPTNVFWNFLAIKSLVKKNENLDVRISMGIGDQSYVATKITQCQGSAFTYSGRGLETIKKEGSTFHITTPNEKLSRELMLTLKWASLEFDRWSPALAEVIYELVHHTEITQDELAKKLQVTQSSISQRIKRANFDLLKETDGFFREKMDNLA